MATIRVMPPADGLHPTIIVNGRSYTCALDATLDVPDFDAAIMLGNGWSAAVTMGSMAAGVGASAARPASPRKGAHFLDSTLGYAILFDGKVWRNPVSGAAV